MSAPEHGPKREARRHRPAIIGIVLALVVAAILLLFYIFYLGAEGTPPEGADTQVRPLTGEEVETDQ